MADEVIEYYGHEFIKLSPNIENYKWQCKKCNHKMFFLERLKRLDAEILSCDERIIKNIIE